MTSDLEQLVALERQFWQSLVDEETEVALGLLAEPSFMVNPSGAMKFDHDTYRRMAEQGRMVLKRYELGEIDATFVSDGTAILRYEVRQVLAPRDGSGETEQRMTDTSTWVRTGAGWRCAMHTETPAAQR